MTSDRDLAFSLTPVSRETGERLNMMVEELIRWQNVKNLVSARAFEQIWTRHIADSLQLLKLAPEQRFWLDMGSGGGFPGLVLAIALMERTGSHMHLVESNARKCAFLRHVARKAGASVTVHNKRIETIVPRLEHQIEVVTARALAPLVKLFEWSSSLLTTGALGLFLKGQDIDGELTEAAKSWTVAASQHASLTDPDGRILIVRHAERRTEFNER